MESFHPAFHWFRDQVDSNFFGPCSPTNKFTSFCDAFGTFDKKRATGFTHIVASFDINCFRIEKKTYFLFSRNKRQDFLLAGFPEITVYCYSDCTSGIPRYGYWAFLPNKLHSHISRPARWPLNHKAHFGWWLPILWMWVLGCMASCSFSQCTWVWSISSSKYSTTSSRPCSEKSFSRLARSTL